jgi:predicted NAD/FAD-dependent oxidoreductase
VFYTLGMRPNEEAVNAIKEAAGEIPVTVVGDALHEGKVADAVHGGYLAAMQVL